MGEATNIAWCDSTFSPWIGCQKVSPGCDFCYAEDMMDKRYHRVEWGQRKTETTTPSVGTRVRTTAANWRQPITWNKHHAAFQAQHGHRQRVFCASLADMFDNQVPNTWRLDLFDLIKVTPELDWLLLTKRPENIAKMGWPLWADGGTPANVWLGFTAEDQEHFDRRWPIMRDIPAVVRFCSYEPAIAPLRLPLASEARSGLGWMICGGESGSGHRPMPVTWAEDIRADCARLGVPFFMKQMAGKKPFPQGFDVVRQFPEVPHG